MSTKKQKIYIYYARKYNTGKYRKSGKNQKNTQNDKSKTMAPL